MKGLPAQAREYLLTARRSPTRRQNDFWKKYNEDDTKRQAQAGIQVITFDAATSKAYVDKA